MLLESPKKVHNTCCIVNCEIEVDSQEGFTFYMLFINMLTSTLIKGCGSSATTSVLFTLKTWSNMQGDRKHCPLSSFTLPGWYANCGMLGQTNGWELAMTKLRRKGKKNIPVIKHWGMSCLIKTLIKNTTILNFLMKTGRSTCTLFGCLVSEFVSKAYGCVFTWVFI